MVPTLTTQQEDTIVALATPPGSSAIAVIRLSGKAAISSTNRIFKGKDLTQQAPATLHFGTIRDQEKIIDEVIVAIFKAPHSFTREDCVEISCHGASFIIRQIIQLLIRQGVRLAKPGEFTQRAFLHGQFDLAQAEAIADLIASDSAIAHQTALYQMRGGFSGKIKEFRAQLIHFASMLALELDFAEEDVVFASRDDLKQLIQTLIAQSTQLIESFELGNVIKNGVPTVIAGKPNAGKSTLLNALLNEEKAIVSDIPGTTRDFIEDELTIEGVKFRLIDTAGLRKTTDQLEAMGVARTHEKMAKASLIIYLFDLTAESLADSYQTNEQLDKLGIPWLKVGNKVDAAPPKLLKQLEKDGFVMISAAQKLHLDVLKEKMVALIHLDKFKKMDTIVTNVRHYESLKKSKAALEDVRRGIAHQLTNELLVLDIRSALHHLGEITGEITTEDVLDNIFSKFCIGK